MRKNIRICIFTLLLCLGLLVSSGCAPSPVVEPEVVKSEFPIEITDQLGRTVKLDKIPQRIISLAPSNTEILFALDLADKIAAVTDYCNYPLVAKEKPSIGGFSTPNIEKIVAISPDLVLATSTHEKKIIPLLEEQGITVFALSPKNFDQVFEAITLVGEITGKRSEASRLIARMADNINAVTEKTSRLSEGQRPGVFYVLWHDPLKTAGSGTFQDELIRKAGGKNIASELTGYPGMALEAVILANPEVMIAGVGHGSGEDTTLQFALNESRLRDTDARRQNRVHAIDVDLVGRAGPRIVDALEQFANFIHPELFERGQ